MPCRTCGSHIPEGVRYCHACGRDAGTATAPATAQGLAIPVQALTPVSSPPVRAAAPVRDPASVAGWIFAGFGAAFVQAILTIFVTLPAESLKTTADGDAIVEHSIAAFLAGLIMLAGGVFALRDAARPKSFAPIDPKWPVVTAVSVALMLTLLLTSKTRALSKSLIYDGVAAGASELDTLLGLVAAVGVITLIVLASLPGNRRGRLMAGSGTILLAYGLTAVLFALWAIANADTLRAAALARERRWSTPGVEFVVLLVTIAVVARNRRRAAPPG